MATDRLHWKHRVRRRAEKRAAEFPLVIFLHVIGNVTAASLNFSRFAVDLWAEEAVRSDWL